MLTSLLVAALLQSATPDTTGWRHDVDVAVPMRDAVVLRADVYRPARGGPFPTLVYRTPYGKHEVVLEYTTVQHAVARGYAVVVQDVRGRYRSAGTFEAYRQEGPDGYDTIEWAAAQPWSNGAVGMFGLSYPGAVQWLAAAERPPHLKAIVPAMSFATPAQFFYSGGAWDLSWASWTAINIAPDVRQRLGIAGPTTEAEARRAWDRDETRVLAQRPLLDLPDFKDIAPWYYEWMRRDPHDPWWAWADLTTKYPRIDAAVLNLSGWHDEAYGPHGATTNFMGLVKDRGSARARTSLLIGPWVHGVEATSRTRSGEREFGRVSAINYDEVVLEFLDHHVRGIQNDAAFAAPVRVFVMGANQWRYADRWPLPGLRADTLFFSSGGALASTSGSGSSSFVSDPREPVRDPFDARYGAHDFRALANRRDLLTFETAAFTDDVDLIGAMVAELNIETDARDVDLYVRVLDVAPDGTAYNLMSPGLELQRASYREPSKGRQPLAPGRVVRLTLRDMLTANRFKRGHKLRVHIMGAFQPHFSLNPQTGESERSSAVLAPARITLRHDAEYRSRLILPVMPRR